MLTFALAVAIICADPEAQPITAFVQELKDIRLDPNLPLAQRGNAEKAAADAILTKHQKTPVTITYKATGIRFERRDKAGRDIYIINVEQPQSWLASAPAGATDRPAIKLPLTAAQANGMKLGDTVTITGTPYVAKVDTDTVRTPQLFSVAIGHLVLPESKTKTGLLLMASSWSLGR